MSKGKSLKIHVGESIIKTSDYKKSLGIKIYSKLLLVIFKIYVKKPTKNHKHWLEQHLN